MRGYSHRIADRLGKETGRHVEYAPLNLVTPYVVDCVGASDAADVRRLARDMDADEDTIQEERRRRRAYNAVNEA